MIKKKPIFHLLSMLALFWMSPVAYGQEASDRQIIEAVRNVYRGGANGKDKAMLLLHNDRLNTLAYSGKLAPGNPGLNHKYYNRAQETFSRLNQRAALEAAREVGVSIELQAQRPGQVDFNPGTDTDLIVNKGPNGKKLTKKTLDALEAAHQKKLKGILRDMGHTPPAGRIDTETDFMVNPDHTDTETFLRQSNEINSRGGAAYTDKGAVRVEIEMRRPGGPGQIKVADAGRYVAQQQLHADRHFLNADQLNHQANQLEKKMGPRPSRAQIQRLEHLRAEAKLAQHKGAKYIKRIHQVTDTVARQNGVEVPRGTETKADRAARRAAGAREALETDGGPRKVRTQSGKTVYARDVDLAAIQTGAVNQNLTRKAVLAHVDTMAKIAAANPGQSAMARDSIARSMARLSPAQQGEVLQSLEHTAGKTFTRDVARQSRQYQRPVPPAATRTLTRKALDGLGTAMQGVGILNVGADIKEVIHADDPTGVLKEKAEAYADGLAGGSITTAQKLGDYLHVKVEHDAYLQGVERVTHQAIEAKLRRMGVERKEAQRISNAFHRGDVEPFRDKALELKAAGVTDPRPGKSGLDGVINWDQDDTAMERLLGIGKGIGEGIERAGTFAKEAGHDTKEVLWGLTDSATVKEILWERDPRLLIDIYRERQYAAEQTGGERQQKISDYLESVGATAAEAQRASAELYVEGNILEFRAFMTELKKRRVEENRRLLAEEARREREADNRQRAAQHQRDLKDFKEMWATYDQMMAEKKARVEAAYREWTDDLEGMSPQEREREYALYGVSPEQRLEIERRLGGQQPKDPEVEAAYQPWVEAMAGSTREEREQAYDSSGLTPEQRAEVEHRLKIQQVLKDQKVEEMAGGGKPRPPFSRGGTEGILRSPGANRPTETGAASEKVNRGEFRVGESLELDFSPPYRQRYPEPFAVSDQENQRKEKAAKSESKASAGSGAGSGTWPEQGDFNGMSMNYSITGVNITGVEEKKSFFTKRTFTGTVSPGSVTLSGSVRNKGGFHTTATFRVNSESKTFKWKESGKESWSMTVPIKPNEGCSFSIGMSAEYRNGEMRSLGVRGDMEAVAVPESEGPSVYFSYASDAPVKLDPGSSADGRTRVTFTEPGIVQVWADVQITEDGQSKTEKSVVHVFEVKQGEPKIALEAIQPEVVFGQSQGLSATITGTDKDTATRVVWNASPEGNTFAQPFTEGPGNTLTFGRMGTVRVFADLEVKQEGSWVKVAESEVQEVEVVAPRFELVFAPANDARIGETLRVKVKTQPTVPGELMDIRWTNPAKRQTHAPDASEISFVIGEGMKDPAAPIPLTALVVAKGSGDRIAEIKDSYTPGSYELKVGEPKFSGPTLQVWDPEKGGLVDAPRGSLATNRQVSITASLHPARSGEVRYAWSVSPEGARTHASIGATQTFSAHKPGSYTVSVIARTPGGLELARGQRMVSVVESRTEPPADANQDPEAENKKRAQKLVREGHALEQKYDLEGALHKYEAAQQLAADKGVAKRIEALRKRIADGERAQALVQQGYQLEKQERFKEALEKYEAAQQLVLNEGVAKRIGMLRKRIADNERAQALVQQGYQLEKQEQLKEALQKYEAAQQLVPNEGVAKRIEMLRTRIADSEWAQKLVQQGYQLEKQERFKGALEKYEAAQQLVPNEGVAKRMETLRRRIADGKHAQALIQKGYALEKRKEFAGAIRKYREAIALTPNDKIDKHISQLQQKLAKPVVSYDGHNRGGVQNGPTAPTRFTLREPRILASIQNYHWNHGRGKIPGTIGVRDQAGKIYGPWPAKARAGSGAQNVYWTARPMIQLSVGTYTVIDSDPDTWSQNSQSNGRGFSKVETLPIEASMVSHETEKPSGSIPEGRGVAPASNPYNLTGTYIMPDHNEVVRTFNELLLVQQGSQVTGEWRARIVYPSGEEDVTAKPFRGEIKGDQLVAPGFFTFTISPDSKTLKADQKGHQRLYRKASGQGSPTQESKKTNLTGSYIAQFSQGGTHATFEFILVQKGSEVSGVMKSRFKEHAEFNDSAKVAGSLRDHRLNMQWMVDAERVNQTFTVSEDFKTLRDEHMTFKRQP